MSRVAIVIVAALSFVAGGALVWFVVPRVGETHGDSHVPIDLRARGALFEVADSSSSSDDTVLAHGAAPNEREQERAPLSSIDEAEYMRGQSFLQSVSARRDLLREHRELANFERRGQAPRELLEALRAESVANGLDTRAVNDAAARCAETLDATFTSIDEYQVELRAAMEAKIAAGGLERRSFDETTTPTKRSPLRGTDGALFDATVVYTFGADAGELRLVVEPHESPATVEALARANEWAKRYESELRGHLGL